MQRFYTDSSFVMQGVSRPDIPFLCDAQMQLVSVPSSYLRFIGAVKGRTRSPRTWRTYGNHLYEFFKFDGASCQRWVTSMADSPPLSVFNDTAQDCWRNSLKQSNPPTNYQNRPLI